MLSSEPAADSQSVNEQTLFTQALEFASTQARDRFLDQLCPDAATRKRLDTLVRLHNRPNLPVDRAAIEMLTVGDYLEDREVIVGQVGPYRLLEPIGEGGMGVVYRAEQTAPVRRLVALKIIKPGMDSRQVIARFESERQALALMDHPLIARVLDAGQTESGRPYFVMELVDGAPITDYCRINECGLAERLRLFIDICQAVQHSHHKGVLHRDLKPSNVLIAVRDGVPLVKVIDFGVAKAIETTPGDQPTLTSTAQVIGTPLYMSPEQAEAGAIDVDTRSDQYSLGVLLYELLTGSPPFDEQRLRQAGYDEMRRIIREEEPPRPSVRLSTLGIAAETAPSGKSWTVYPRLGRLRGELDWIVMRALEKDRDRRYATVQELADDVCRFLANEPVRACPPSRWYQLRKFVVRHRFGVATSAAFAALLIGTTAGMSILAVRARDAESLAEDRLTGQIAARKEETEARRLAEAALQTAERDRRATETVVTFLEEDLLGQLKFAGGGPNATWKSIIDRSAARIGERFRDQPLVEAALRHTLGVTYFRLRELSTAQQHLSRALHLRSTTLGRDDAKTLQSQHALGYALLHMERFDEAAAQFREEHRVRLDRYGPTDPDTHEALERLVHALVDGGDYVAAEPLARSALQSAIECHGKVSLQAIDCARRMADVCRRLKRDRFHAELVEEALRMSSEFETQPLPGELLLPWAELLTRLDRPELSITFYEQALHWHEQQLGVDDPATITALGNLAVNQWLLLENYSAAIANLEEATTRMERRMGPGSPALLSYLRNLGECCLASGRHDRAAEVLSRAVRIAASNYSEGEPVRLRLLLSLGQAHKARGQIDNARQAFEEVLENSTESSRETQGFNRLARSAIEEIEKQSIQ